MSFLEIADIILIVLCVLAYAAKAYFQVKGNVLGAVSELVALAEESGLAGHEKMAQVVEELFLQVPHPLRKIFTKERIENIAQQIFDWMRRYADTYAEVTAEASSDEDREKEMGEAISALNAEAAAEIASELIGLTLAAMKEKATEYGAEIDGKETKKEVAQAIILAVMNKA